VESRTHALVSLDARTDIGQVFKYNLSSTSSNCFGKNGLTYYVIHVFYVSIFLARDSLEAALAYLSLEQHGVEVQCIAPDILQARVVDHAHSRPETTPRNALTEAARIARENILPLTSVSPLKQIYW
jgi:hypothetical protein